MTPPDHAERRLARLLLVLIVLAALVPLPMKKIRKEPYPTLLMPSFGGSPLTAGELVWPEISIVAITDDGAHLDITAEQLLPRVRVVRSAVLRSALFSGLDAAGRPVRTPRRSSLPGRVITGLPEGMTIQGTVRAYDPRTIAWLQARMRVLFPDGRITQVRFTLENKRMRPDSPEIIEAEPSQVVTVTLSGMP